jgi:AraC-like DNA-binding protein
MWYLWVMAGPRRSNHLVREARVTRVRQGICETIAPFDLRIGDDQDCRVDVESVEVGVARIVWAPGAALVGEAFRTPRLIRRSDPDLCKIDLQVGRRTVIEQDDRQAELRRGEFSFVDLSQPSRLVGELNGLAAVMFPRSLLPLRYGDTRQLTGTTFRPDEANSALVTTLVGQVVSRLDEYRGPRGARVGTAMLDLITAALSTRLDRPEAVPPDAQLRVLTMRIKAFIEARLGDTRLSPGQIAAVHHISLRYLYRIFEAEQTSVGAWIRGRRLEHCRRDLTDPALHERTVSTIGSRWGFIDATHFGRAFKIQYGVTPSEYRRLGALSTPDRPAQ